VGWGEEKKVTVTVVGVEVVVGEMFIVGEVQELAGTCKPSSQRGFLCKVK
jgi:hypothetical protein